MVSPSITTNLYMTVIVLSYTELSYHNKDTMQLLHCWWSWCMMTKAQMQQTRGEGTDRGWPPGSLAHQTRRRSADTPSAVVSADNNDDRTEFVGDM